MGGDPETLAYLDKDTDSMLVGNYLARNNTYNRASAGGQPYAQSIRIFKAGVDNWAGRFEWTWPVGTGQIKAYPEVIFGRSPWMENAPTVPWLPAKLSALPAIRAEFDYDIVPLEASSFDTTFDLWLTADETAHRGNVMAEVMMLVGRENFTLDPKTKAGTFEIDGGKYDLHISTPSWKLLVFVRSDLMKVGTLNITEFLKFLMDNKHLPDSLYLADIEFGNEVVKGRATNTIRSYRVTVK